MEIEVQRFRKTAVIEAIQFTRENADAVRWWSRAQMIEKLDGSRSLLIPTLEGDHWANLGDWIIRGVAGEFYPCKPEIFEATYEAVDQ